MDRALLIEHLTQAERHIAEGVVCLERQRDLIADLARGGHDTSQAEVLLLEFEHSQTLYVASYDQIREELNGSGLRK
ncbi:MAG: hypothetical protein JO042_15635 [Sinobacteraceae bacterium]|nr:hypothetical protein [Nevskiaceae bacterium]